MHKSFIELQVCSPEEASIRLRRRFSSGKWADVQLSSWESVTGPGSGLGLQNSECWNLGCKWNSRKGCSQWSSLSLPVSNRSEMWMIVFMRLTYFCKSAIKFFLHIANETPLSKAFYQWKLGPCEAKKRPEVCRAGISLSQGGKCIGKHRNCDDVSVLAIDIQHLRQLTLLSCPFMLQLGFTAVAMPLASKSDLIIDVNQRHSYWYTKIDTCWDPVGYSISHGCSFNHSSFQGAPIGPLLGSNVQNTGSASVWLVFVNRLDSKHWEIFTGFQCSPNTSLSQLCRCLQSKRRSVSNSCWYASVTYF